MKPQGKVMDEDWQNWNRISLQTNSRRFYPKDNFYHNRFFPIFSWLFHFNFTYLSGDTASCLHNAPHEDEALGRQLPGTLLTLDAQCRRDRGTSACFKDERVCAQLFCFDAASGYCVAYRPAAEGSSCGDGQVILIVSGEFLFLHYLSGILNFSFTIFSIVWTEDVWLNMRT